MRESVRAAFAPAPALVPVAAQAADRQVEAARTVVVRNRRQLVLVQPGMLVQQHQAVYAPLQSKLSTGELHALALKTFTPEQWARTQG